MESDHNCAQQIFLMTLKCLGKHKNNKINSSLNLGPIDVTEQKLMEKDAELRRMQEMLARMQEQMKQQSTTNLANY